MNATPMLFEKYEMMGLAGLPFNADPPAPVAVAEPEPAHVAAYRPTTHAEQWMDRTECVNYKRGACRLSGDICPLTSHHPTCDTFRLASTPAEIQAIVDDRNTP